jgi:hypothetical protein
MGDEGRRVGEKLRNECIYMYIYTHEIKRMKLECRSSDGISL